MTRKITLGIIAALIIVISIISIKGNKPAAPATTNEAASSEAASSQPLELTVDEVAKHNSASSCYTIVNGNVYDMTNWISQHPGGQRAIKSMCGIDASAMFNNQHGGQGGPERILASYKLGALN